jgi:benzoyl-CoA reductase/2-hydroxyglutaryl-CoA dehydratase subunit BcrC/BadD/HgdB
MKNAIPAMSNLSTLEPPAARTTTPAPPEHPRHHHPSAPRSGADSEAIKKLGELQKGYTLEQIEQWAGEGRSVIWGGNSWEAPLIRACDTIPVGFAELWKTDSVHAETVAENHFQIPGEFCSMIKAMIGRLHLRKDNKIKRILYFGSTCEPISMVLDHAHHDGFDVHCIDAATAFKVGERRTELVAFLVNELQKVSVWLTGKRVDEDRLAAELKFKNKIMHQVRRILDLRLKAPFYLNAPPTAQLLMGSNHYFGKPAEFEAVVDQVLRDLEAAGAEPETRYYIPLVLAGGIAGGPKLLKVIEEANGVILGWVIHSTSDFREDVPPLESVAHYLFDAQLKGELGEGAGASATLRRRRVEELVDKTKARGIISSFVTGCPYGSVVQGLERQYFKKKGVAFVGLEHSVHAEEPPTEEQVTRIKAFVEMLAE